MARLIPRNFVDDLISRSDIVEIINQRVPLKKRGANYEACCPFHNEKTASFKVSAAKQIYHCFGCGKGGNAISFLMEYDRLDFVEAVEQLASQLSLTVPFQNNATTQEQRRYIRDEKFALEKLLQRISQFYTKQLNQAIGTKAGEYLAKRGIKKTSMANFQLGYAPASWDAIIKNFATTHENRQTLLQLGLIINKGQHHAYDRFRDRLMFPIKNRRGQIIAFGGRSLDGQEPKYLNSPDSNLFHKSQELYGLYEVLQQTQQNLPYLIVVEGYLDVISLHEQGLPYAVAPLGTALTQEHLRRLCRYTDKIYFCFDGDNAGQNAAWRSLTMTLTQMQRNLTFYFVQLPAQHDPDSFIRAKGHASFESLLAQAPSQADFFFQHIFANATTLDAKNQACQQALILIRQMQDDIYQKFLLNKLAELTGLTLPELTQKPNVNTTTQTKSNPSSSTALRLFMALLVMQPNLIEKIVDME
ncbi:MAG: DNA primase, partial [Pseudomonadota bacterium]